MAEKRIFDIETEATIDDITQKVYAWFDKKAQQGEVQEPSWKFDVYLLVKILNNFATKFVPNVLTVVGKCYWHGGELFVCNVAYTGDWVPANFTATSIDELFARKDVLSALQTAVGNLQDALETTNGNVTALTTYAQNVAHSIAPEYDGTTGAVAGKLYMHEGILYRCKTTHSGAWGTGSDFEAASVDELYYYGYPISYQASGLNITGTVKDYKINFNKGDRLIHELTVTGTASMSVFLIKSESPLDYISITSRKDYIVEEYGFKILRVLCGSHTGPYDIDFNFTLMNENVSDLKTSIEGNKKIFDDSMLYEESHTGTSHYFYSKFKKNEAVRIKLTGVTNTSILYGFKEDDTYDTLVSTTSDVDKVVILQNDYKSIRYITIGSEITCNLTTGILENFDVYNKVVNQINRSLINEDDLKMCLPAKLFVVEGLPYNIYASSIMLDDFKNVDIFTQARTTSNFGADLLQIGKVCKIENLKNCTLRVGFEDYVKRNTGLVYKDLNVDYKEVQAAVSKNVIIMGDSITNRGAGYFSKKAAESVNCNVTGYGTMTNYNSFPGEGREGWTFADFIGKSNVCGSGVITPMGSGTTGSLTKNPFIRVATSDDLTNYPDFCFANTGVNSEKSYSEDSSLGTYYIFDFSYYLNRFADLPTIDVVTIALGTNDIVQNYQLTDIIAYAGFMVSQIKDALPDAKIAFIPSPAWGATYSNFALKVVPYIEAMKTLANSLTVDVIGMWCFLSRFHSFGLNTSDVDIINPSTDYAPYQDNIHYDLGDGGTYAYIEYGKVLASYILQ